MRKLLLIFGILLLFAGEILRVYFIMPFPGSQQSDTIGLAYFLHCYLVYVRIFGLLLIAYPVYKVFGSGKLWIKIILSIVLLCYAGIFYLFNFRFLAEKIFYQPLDKIFVQAGENIIASRKLVLGVVINGEAKAYPIEIIGYHHQVQDTVGGEAVIVTYCTVCRTGRVYSPQVDGKKESFRLVGMDHFNAMFEDATTKSWWYQATGEAVAGPLKGTALKEIPSQHMSLRSWLRNNPNSYILQPDTHFTKQYEHLKGFDEGTIVGSLEQRDTASWKFKSWVIGVEAGGMAKAYDWNTLLHRRMIQDSLAGVPVVLSVEIDGSSFHVFNRIVDQQVLQFTYTNSRLIDSNTQSYWSDNGLCIDGALKGRQLQRIQASQEFWHSWQTFHPATEQYLH